ncbi:MAG: hypothetical protein J3R72DRAFT_455555 [Linnemannia gamsii]|nr:hypothetical protein BGX24_005216 [Mortierella sp. AD032]KAK3830721.1 MAG: hypothetical protein J3R72DRAFT_455555 [Linnemannia gamsii]
MHAQTSFLLVLILAFLAIVTSAQKQPEEALACYQSGCSSLIGLLQDCKVTVDPTTGNINFPVESNTSATTDKCLCTQKIVNAYDPCYTCGAENQKIQTRFSTQTLVDSCNLNFGALTVSMPGTSSGLSSHRTVTSSKVLGLVVVLVSFLVMV